MIPKTFNIKTGELIVYENFAISSKTSISEIEANFGKLIFSTKKDETEFVKISLRNLKIGEFYFFFDFTFKDEILNRYSFLIQSKAFAENPSWDDWDGAENDANNHLVKKWFEEHVSKKLEKHAWGTIGLFYDFHNMLTDIQVVFKK